MPASSALAAPLSCRETWFQGHPDRSPGSGGRNLLRQCRGIELQQYYPACPAGINFAGSSPAAQSRYGSVAALSTFNEIAALAGTLCATLSAQHILAGRAGHERPDATVDRIAPAMDQAMQCAASIEPGWCIKALPRAPVFYARST